MRWCGDAIKFLIHTLNNIFRRHSISNIAKCTKINYFLSLSHFLHGVFQDDHKAFRRQLEDKRPIVESNLLSGKQYVASEPPVSDASDTEGKAN